jgi:two-component system alkaline phosphatase synthesis response regulator PhoP
MNKIDKKILIVEDDKALLWILKQAFDEAGFSVVYAQDGQEGVEMAQLEHPDLIMLDILMPKMDGIEAAKQIRKIGIATPIIFLTNLNDLQHISKAVEATSSDYIVKSDMPINKVVARVKEKLGVK